MSTNLHFDMHRIIGLVFLLYVVTASENRFQKRNEERQRRDKAEKQSYGELGDFVRKDFTFDGRKDPEFPWSRETINANFILYTKEHTPQAGSLLKIKVNDDDSVKNANFKQGKAIKILIHGFQGAGTNSWLNNVATSFLSKEDINVIAVDWSGGSGYLHQYEEATANTWVVGGEIWLLCKYLVENEKFNASYDKIHIIGHSLGAHTAGYAGSRMQGQLGRITGLDPAEPNFQYAPINMRLDPTDAKFVDVIHTDASPYVGTSGYGLSQSVGHLDFYPNGGEDQPGCKKKRQLRSADKEKRLFSCHHSRATELFDASITTTCPFVAHQCNSNDSLVSGSCNSCGTNGERCARMGYHANEHPNPSGGTDRKFYLLTSDRPPYCLYHYSVDLTLENDVTSEAYLYLTFYGEKTTHSLYFWIEHKGGNSLKNVVGVPHDLGVVNKVEVKITTGWTGTYNPLMVKNIVVEPIDIIPQSDRAAATKTLCQKTKQAIEKKTPYTFKSSNCH